MAHVVYKVRHGIETSVSVPVVVSENVDEETGKKVQNVEERQFLPGATLPENLADYFVEKLEAGEDDEHVFSLIEPVEVEGAKPKAAPKKTEAKASAAKKASSSSTKKSDDDNPFAASGE